MPHIEPTPPYDDQPSAPDGDMADAFNELVRVHYGRLCSFVYRHVGSAEAAEDIVQDTFIKVWRRRQQLDFDRPLAYLYRAARNEAISYHRRHRVRERTLAEIGRQDSPSAPDSAKMLERAELAAAVAEAVDALPERCRLVFTMHREQGLTYAEIADTLGISVKTVETQISRAFRALRSRLAHYLAIAVTVVSAGMKVV